MYNRVLLRGTSARPYRPVGDLKHPLGLPAGPNDPAVCRWGIFKSQGCQKETTFQCSALTSLVSTFAHETREIAHETSFHECSRNEFSRNEFFAFAHETSFHETSFSLCSRNEFSRNEFLCSAHETSFHETSFLRCSRNEFSRNEFPRNEFLALLTKRVFTKRVSES